MKTRKICGIVFFLMPVSLLYPIGEKALFPVRNGRYTGYANRNGELVVDAIYAYAGAFSEELGMAKKFDETYDCLNTEGEVVFNIEANSVEGFSNGFAAIERNGKWGFINTKGEIVIKPQYRYVESFSQDKVAVTDQNKSSFYIDSQNRNVFDTKYDNCWSFNEGYAVIENEDGERAVINSNGKVVTPWQDHYANHIIFEKTWCYRTEDNTKYICINLETLQEIFEFPLEEDEEYLPIGYLQNGYIPAGTPSRGWGILNIKGEVVVEYQYSHISAQMSEGIYTFTRHIKGYSPSPHGYITAEGEIIAPARFRVASLFEYGLASIMERDGRRGYLNKKGEIAFYYADVFDVE